MPAAGGAPLFAAARGSAARRPEGPGGTAYVAGKAVGQEHRGAVWAPAPLFAAPAPETVAASRASPAPRRVRGRGPTMRRGRDGHARARAPQSTPAGVRARTATVGFAAWKHCEKFLSPARVRGCA